jgi:hypothetical protein
MIEAFEVVAQTLPNAKLVIGGGDHPQAAGYVESVRQKCAGNPRIEFTGYVPEDRLPGLFQGTTVAVMPYSSSTGCSGVAHLACAYGVPILCADLLDFRQMAEGEEIAIDFYKPGDAQDLADCLIRFLNNPARQEEMAAQNYFTALRMTMPTIVLKYLRHFELDQRADALRQITRFRRLPKWVPSKALMLRLMTRNSSGWIYRSAVRRPAINRTGRNPLLNDHVNGGGKLNGTRTPSDGDGISERSGSRAGTRGLGGGGLWTGIPSAGSGNHSAPENQDDGERLKLTPSMNIPDEGETEYAEGQQPAAMEWDRTPLLGQVHPRNGNGRNGKG